MIGGVLDAILFAIWLTTLPVHVYRSYIPSFPRVNSPENKVYVEQKTLQSPETLESMVIF